MWVILSYRPHILASHLLCMTVRCAGVHRWGWLCLLSCARQSCVRIAFRLSFPDFSAPAPAGGHRNEWVGGRTSLPAFALWVRLVVRSAVRWFDRSFGRPFGHSFRLQGIAHNHHEHLSPRTDKTLAQLMF